MEETIPASQVPSEDQQYQPQPPVVPQNAMPPRISLEQLKAMKAQAMEIAIQQATARQGIQVPVQAPPSIVPTPPVAPNVVYVRRNLTIAELILIFAIACGLVTGVQFAWNFAANVLPKIEIKVK